MTPADTLALEKVWKEQREYEATRHADVMAALLNLSMRDMQFTPPAGKVWRREMFLPGWITPAADAKAEPDWKKTKESFALFTAIHKWRNRPIAEKRAHQAALKAAQKALAERRQKAREMQEAGEPPEKIRAMMKGLPYG